MKPASIPWNEEERLKELLSLEILDSENEKPFDEIVQLASHFCSTPISLITLVDETRQWFKAEVGLGINETSRDVSFCSHAIVEEKDDVFIVEDASKDERFKDNPLVTDNPNIKFYAGYPLQTSNGHKIGTLCVIDTVQRKFSNEQRMALQLLAKQVIKELELRKTSRDLTRKNQILNGILTYMPVIAYRLNPQGLIREAKGLGLDTLGYTEDQLLGNNAKTIFPHLKEVLEEVLHLKKRRFISNIPKDEGDLYFENYIFPDETNPGKIIGLAIDITEPKRIEQELKKAKESAEKASQSKSRFLANMSHEIRTPISAILGFANELKKQNLSTEALEYLNYISSSGEILLKLIGDILDLTRIEEGIFELQEEVFHLKELFISNLSPYKFKANEKGLDFELLFEENITSYAIGDVNKISQIIINLIGNALKFTERGGIKVHFSTENPGVSDSIFMLKVKVIDTGIGIASEKLELIFQTFVQADLTIHQKFGGSGLGLAIVKELVERMGGQIGVESNTSTESTSQQLGSTFWFTIPLKVANEPELKDEINRQIIEEIDYEQSVHVLLVEDNELNQRLAGVMLKNMGCKFTIAKNGVEAIKNLKENDYQLILMDIQMPVMNGYDTTRNIRERLNLSLPIIGLSANVYKEEIEQCYEAGMNDYLGKPYTEKRLREKIIKWIPVFTKADELLNQKIQSNEGKLVNLTYLIKLFKDDQESIKEMALEFIYQQEEMIVQMEEALKIKDFGKFNELSHNMRSSILAVGLEALHDPLLTIETMAKSGKDLQLIEENFKKIQMINNKAIEELNVILVGYGKN